MSLLFEYDFFLFLPEMFLITAALLLLVYGVVISPKQAENPEVHLIMSHITWLCSFCVLLTGVLVWNLPIESGFAFFHSLVIDVNSSFCKLLILGSSASCFIISISYFKKENINAYEYAILLLIATASMLLMVSSYDLLSLYLTIELQSLAFYVLAASKRHSEFSTEAGIKYFLLGAFSSGIFLFGTSMIYGFTGTTQFAHITQLFTGFASSSTLSEVWVGNQGMIVGVLCVSIGFLFKLGAAPFHMWAPDVYEGAPTPMTAFFSIVPKIAFLSVFLRFFVL